MDFRTSIFEFGVWDFVFTRSPDHPITRSLEEDMIQGNQTWTQALAQTQKQPYYLVEIPDFAIAIASFSVTANVVPIALSGYGVTLYGIGGYGT